MCDFEELEHRMEAWLSGDGAQLLQLLISVGSHNCGLPAEDSSAAAIATIQRFVHEAGRTPDPPNDFRQLMDIFKEELKPRVAGLRDSSVGGPLDLVDPAQLRAMLDAFPGGYMASNPDVPSEDWRNAVLAALSKGDDPDPMSPWVHPAADDGPPPVSLLVERLFDADPQVRCAAAVGLARHGRNARPAHAALTEALGDPDPEVRAAVRRAIRAIAE